MEPEIPQSENTPLTPTPPTKSIPFTTFVLIIGSLFFIILVLLVFLLKPKSTPQSVENQIEPSPAITTLLSPFPSPSSLPTLYPTKSVTIKPSLIPSPTDIISDLLKCNSVSPVADSDPFFGPAIGSAPLFISFTKASGSSYPPASFVGFQWDFDGNGVWDTQVINPPPSASYTYPKNGTYQPKFRTRGSNNAWSSVCNYPDQITVGTANEYSNDTISVNHLQFNTTISKSQPDSVPKLPTNGGRYAYREAFIISSKDKFTFPSITPSGNYDLSIYEPSVNLESGLSYRFHLVIDLTKPNGTYTGSALIKYTTDNGTKTQSGPTFNYSVTLTD